MGIKLSILIIIILFYYQQIQLKDDFNETTRLLISRYKLPENNSIYRKFKDCFPLSDYNDIIEKLFNIDYKQQTINYKPFNSIILNELLKINNYTYINQIDNNDYENYKYYDENYKELNITAKDYFNYLFDKYLEYNNNKTNFINNLKYHFNMKNKNKYIHKIPYRIINNINDNKKRCILNAKIDINNFNDFNFEHSFIAINKKDYNNHKLIYKINKHQYENINTLMGNYYSNLCNMYDKICGNNNKYLYYYPYFKSYNVNIFNYIFNRIYKSFINFDIKEMLNNVSNINEMSENILIGIPVEDKNFNLIYDMFPNIII